MIARALAQLMIPMGIPVEPKIKNYEDPEFVALLHTAVPGLPDRKRLRQLIAKRNAQHKVWGFKVPTVAVSLPLIEADFRNPCFIFCFRDLLAAALRDQISTGTDLVTSYRFYAQLYSTIGNFIGCTASPCLLVSYEKALLDPQLFCQTIGAFAGQSPGPSVLGQMIRQVRPSHPDYV